MKVLLDIKANKAVNNKRDEFSLDLVEAIQQIKSTKAKKIKLKSLNNFIAELQNY